MLELVRILMPSFTSFLHLHLDHATVVTLSRVALKDFTFSDGTCLPAGTFISVPLYTTHHDESRYSNPDEFDPDRFTMSEEHGGDGPKPQMVTPNADYIPWGLGRHAWCVEGHVLYKLGCELTLSYPAPADGLRLLS